MGCHVGDTEYFCTVRVCIILFFFFFWQDISILVTPHFGECFFRSAFQKYGCKVMFTLGLLVVITLFCDGMVLCTSCMLKFDVCMVRCAPADGHGC